MIKKTLIAFSIIFSIALLFLLCFNVVNADSAKNEYKKEYAVALTEYSIDDFDKSTLVVSPSGKTLNTDGKFVLTELGVYKIFKNTSLVTEITVLYSALPVNFDLDENVVESIYTNVSFVIPKATVYSSYETFKSYSVFIEKEDVVIVEYENVHSEFNYSFDKSGNYVIKYSVVDSFGFTVDRSFNVEVLPKAEIVNLNFSENWSVLNTIDFSKVQGLYEGVSYDVDITLLNPEKEKVAVINNRYTFAEKGNYVATFKCNFDGNLITEQKEFNVVLSEASYFSDGKNIVSITPNAQTLSKKGLEIRADGVGSYIYYNKAINLDEFTKNDKLIDFFVPYTEYSDVSDIRITLIDAVNPENYFSVYWRRSKSVGWEHLTYCLVEYNGYSVAISNETGATLGKLREIYGANLVCSFIQENKSSFNITYSTEENAVYTYRTDAKGTYLVKLIDFDDSELLGKYLPWNGFTTSDVYLKVDFINNVESAIIINSIDNKDLTQNGIAVENEDYLKFNYKGENYLTTSDFDQNKNLVINAYVNNKCNLPIPISTSPLFGDFDVSLIVYFNMGQFVEIENQISDYSFIPTEIGEYRAIYSYTDYYGNKRQKIFDFVVNSEPAPEINIHFAGKGVNELTISENYLTTIAVPEIVCEGGVGKIVGTTTYMLNGSVEIAPNEYGEIYLDTKGYIDVIVTAIDEINAKKTVTLKILINSDIQVIWLSEEPNSFMAGREIILPTFTANDYCFDENDVGFNMGKSVYVDGVLVSGTSFICPTDKESVTLTFYGAKGTLKEVKKEIVVKVVSCNNENQTLLNELFSGVDDALSTSLFEEGYKIDFNTDLSVNYVNPLVAREFAFSFSLIENNFDFDSLDFKLCDYQDSNNYLLISFKNLSLDSLDMYLNGEKVATVSGRKGQYESKTLKGVTYSNYSVCLYDYLRIFTLDNKTVLTTITHNSVGRNYNGFESGLLLLTMSMSGVKSSSSLVVRSFSNQNFTSYAIMNGKDKTLPQIGLLSEFGKIYSYLEQASIPKAVASDVLQGKVDGVDLKVTTPSGKVYNFNASNDNMITFNEYGNYSFVYTSSDYYGNSGKLSFYITIIDREKPVLEINDQIPNEIACGTTVKLGNFYATDNIGVKTKKVCVYTPESAFVEISVNYTFTAVGNYKVIYYACDEVGNFVKEIYEIKVK